MSRLQIILDQIASTRRYTCWILEHTPDTHWFKMPIHGTTHVGWQVGHITWSQQVHILQNVCGLRPDHPDFSSAQYGALFGKNTFPKADAALYPPPTEIRAEFDRIHTLALNQLALHTESMLDEPPVTAHWAAKNRFDMLVWNIKHEMLHAGQIGLCRRLLGMTPYR